MNKLKLAGIAIGILLTIGIINRIFNGKEIDKRNEQRAIEAQKPQINQDSLRYAKALEVIKQEQKIGDAFITDAHVLYASVKDDGTNRNGYAEYLCQVLKNNNVNDVRVKVIKIRSSNDPKRDNAYGVLLGESDCRF